MVELQEYWGVGIVMDSEGKGRKQDHVARCGEKDITEGNGLKMQGI